MTASPCTGPNRAKGSAHSISAVSGHMMGQKLCREEVSIRRPAQGPAGSPWLGPSKPAAPAAEGNWTQGTDRLPIPQLSPLTYFVR